MTTLDHLKARRVTAEPCAVKFEGIHSLAFAPQQPELLYLGCGSERLLAFDLEQQKIVRRAQFLDSSYALANQGSIENLLVHPVTGTLYTANFRSLRVLSPALRLRHTIELTGRCFPQLALSPDATQLAVSDYTVCRLYDLTQGPAPRFIRHFEVGRWARGVAFSADGQQLFVGAYPDYRADRDRCNIQVWDLRTGTKTGELRGHTCIILALVASPDGTTLASSDEDFVLKKWDLRTGTELLVGGTANGEEVQMRYSPDFSVLATACLSQVAALRDPATLEMVWHQTTGESVSCVGFSADGRRFAAGETNGTLHLWRLG